MTEFQLDFVCVGPQRTGTSWLHQVLQHHPKLCFPKGVDEPMFFDRYYDQGPSRYIAYFAHCKEKQLCGDISPTYFDVQEVPYRIHKTNPKCKIIINIRNPIDRAVSLYHHHLSRGRVRGSFAEAVVQMPCILNAGRYAQHIPRWLNIFGKDQVTFIVLDDIRTIPEVTLNQIYSFLDVEPTPMPENGNRKINKSTMPRFSRLAKINAQVVTYFCAMDLYWLVEWGKKLGLKKLIYEGGSKALPKPSPDDTFRLEREYEIDIVFLEDLLKRDFSLWRQNPVCRTQCQNQLQKRLQ